MHNDDKKQPEITLDRYARAELIVDEMQRFMDNHHGLYLAHENIAEGLQSARNVYAADIAFILEMDTELNVYSIMSAELRNGLEGFGDIITRGPIGKNLFGGVIKEGQPSCFSAEDLSTLYPKEHEWMVLNGVRNIMLNPIMTRTQMNAFIGVCNIERLYGDHSMLSFTTFMLTNEIRAVTVMDKYTRMSSRAVILEDNDVLVNMFGGFEIWTRLGKLGFDNFVSSKCCLLLVYLIFNRSRLVPVRELAEILWPDQLFDNPYNMIKGVAFRLRKLIDPICEKKVVIAQHGTYVLNSELNLMIDTSYFENVYKQIKQPGMTMKDKHQLYKHAIASYKGNLLPNFEDEIWLVGKINYYQIMFSTIVKEYLLFLDQMGLFEEFFMVVSQVLNIVYPDGDIYNLIISVLVRQNRMDIARNCYLKVEKRLSPEQRQVFIDLWNKTGFK